jgi:hypothetical protein
MTGRDSEAKISSSTMIGSLRPLNGQERVVCNVINALRLGQSRFAPDLRRVTAIAEALQARRQAPLFGRESRQPEGRGIWDERNRESAMSSSGSMITRCKPALRRILEICCRRQP